MKQEHVMAAHQCESLSGSVDNQEAADHTDEDSVSQLAEAVAELVQDAIGEVGIKAHGVKDIVRWNSFLVSS
jgi:hypothetical protein